VKYGERRHFTRFFYKLFKWVEIILILKIEQNVTFYEFIKKLVVIFWIDARQGRYQKNQKKARTQGFTTEKQNGGQVESAGKSRQRVGGESPPHGNG
jgi:hypothetical protein